MFSNPWLQYVKVYQKKHPELSYKEVLQEAPVSYRKLKKHYGGNGNNDSKNLITSSEWNKIVKPEYIRTLPCFKSVLTDKGQSLVQNTPFEFIIRKTTTKVSPKVQNKLQMTHQDYEILEVWVITYQKYDDTLVEKLAEYCNKKWLNDYYHDGLSRQQYTTDEYNQEYKKRLHSCLKVKILSDPVNQGKYTNILCVHTSHGFCTTEQNKFYNTIGEFIYGEMPGQQRLFMLPYNFGSNDYLPEHIHQLEVKEGTTWNYE